MNDLKFAFRQLLKNPGFTTVAVLTLALGIGANTAIFSLIQGILLKPLPYPDSERLMLLTNINTNVAGGRFSVSIPDYFDRRERTDTFESMGLYTFGSINLTSDGIPERIIGIRATASVFETLQVLPQIGRTFNETEDQPGREKVVVIGHDLWQSRFGGSSDVTSRTLEIDGEAHEILGVMPASFQFPNPRVKLWRPFAITPEQKLDDQRGQEFSLIIARLKTNATIHQARSQIDAIHLANREKFPESRKFWETSGFGGVVIGYQDSLVENVKGILYLLWGGVWFVLLIACVNVSNFLLTRIMARSKELAVRAAMGAGRIRIALQMLTENLVLGLAGGIGGLVLALWGAQALTALANQSGAMIPEISLEPRILVYAAAVSVLSVVVFGALPSLYVLGGNLAGWIKSGSQTVSDSRSMQRVRSSLIITQIALAIVLLSGAGLMLNSFSRLIKEQPGFEPSNVLTAFISLPESQYDADQKIVGFWDRLIERVGALPAVKSASVSSATPFGAGIGNMGSYTIRGYEHGPNEPMPHSFMRVVSDEYFSSIGIPLLVGRTFDRRDIEEGAPVVVVDQRLVDKYWPGENPVGRFLGRGPTWYEIVGVVGSIKQRNLSNPVKKETVYFPIRQRAARSMAIVLKTAADPSGLIGPVRSTIRDLDPKLPISDIRTMDERIWLSLSSARAPAWLLSGFSVVAVGLAALGVYGTLSFLVNRRFKEIGTRMALGAKGSDILGMVIRRGMKITAFGILIGLLGSLLLSQFLSAMLFEVRPSDPWTHLGSITLLGLVCLISCYIPARRATNIDPMVALRDE